MASPRPRYQPPASWFTVGLLVCNAIGILPVPMTCRLKSTVIKSVVPTVQVAMTAHITDVGIEWVACVIESYRVDSRGRFLSGICWRKPIAIDKVRLPKPRGHHSHTVGIYVVGLAAPPQERALLVSGLAVFLADDLFRQDEEAYIYVDRRAAPARRGRRESVAMRGFGYSSEES